MLTAHGGTPPSPTECGRQRKTVGGLNKAVNPTAKRIPPIQGRGSPWRGRGQSPGRVWDSVPPGAAQRNKRETKAESHIRLNGDYPTAAPKNCEVRTRRKQRPQGASFRPTERRHISSNNIHTPHGRGAEQSRKPDYIQRGKASTKQTLKNARAKPKAQTQYGRGTTAEARNKPKRPTGAERELKKAPREGRLGDVCQINPPLSKKSSRMTRAQPERKRCLSSMMDCSIFAATREPPMAVTLFFSIVKKASSGCSELKRK